jgi:hypothetical protein
MDNGSPRGFLEPSALQHSAAARIRQAQSTYTSDVVAKGVAFWRLLWSVLHVEEYDNFLPTPPDVQIFVTVSGSTQSQEAGRRHQGHRLRHSDGRGDRLHELMQSRSSHWPELTHNQ